MSGEIQAHMNDEERQKLLAWMRQEDMERFLKSADVILALFTLAMTALSVPLVQPASERAMIATAAAVILFIMESFLPVRFEMNAVFYNTLPEVLQALFHRI